jgi:fatty acid synthase subunit alpha
LKEPLKSRNPPPFVFTGQGSQEPGMGMDLYNSSPAARAVWDAADEHLLAVYGFSIIDIVKHNPKDKTIHFGGIKGQAIRQRYIDMTFDTLDKDGNVKTLPLFTDINVRTQRYTFSHPNGLLFATQFAQIALVVTEKAAFDDMRSKGLIQRDSAFAGHSLGEYSALASIADVLPISSLVDVVFYRGITMQSAVERDSQNRSNYAMCAVNPSRISKTFNEAALREVVEIVGTRTGALLEIVNYNVDVCHHHSSHTPLAHFGFSGLAICRSRRPSRPPDYNERSQLSKEGEHRSPEGKGYIL